MSSNNSPTKRSKLHDVVQEQGGIPMEADNYYNNNSRPQLEAAKLGFTQWKQCIERIQTKFSMIPYLHVVDYGSSQGGNSIEPMKLLIHQRPQVQVTHTDLVFNDFNSLIRLMGNPTTSYVKDPSITFVSARGGSFYKQIFPPLSVHLAYSSIATHWLSNPHELQGPEFTLSKLHVHQIPDSHKSKQLLIERAKKDWQDFIHMRAIEFLPGAEFFQVGISRDDQNISGIESIMDTSLAVANSLYGIERAAQCTKMIPTYHRTVSEWLAPFLTEEGKKNWKIQHCDMVISHDAHYKDFINGIITLDQYVEKQIGVLRAAYLRGVFPEGIPDVDLFVEKLRSEIIKQPECVKADWRIVLLCVERI
jgi:hypothetical protein